MRNQEKPKNNVSSKQYFEAGGGGGGMVGAGKGCERKKSVSGEGWERKWSGEQFSDFALLVLFWGKMAIPCDPLLKSKQNKLYNKTKCSLKCQPVLLARGGRGGWGVGLSPPHPPQVSAWRTADISELVINFKITILLKLLKTVRKISWFGSVSPINYLLMPWLETNNLWNTDKSECFIYFAHPCQAIVYFCYCTNFVHVFAFLLLGTGPQHSLLPRCFHVYPCWCAVFHFIPER